MKYLSWYMINKNLKKVPRSELLFYVPLVALTAVCVSIAVQTKNAKQDENVVWLRKKMLLTYSFNFTMFSSNQSNRRLGILSLKNKFNSSHKIQDLLDGLWCDTSAVLKRHAFRFACRDNVSLQNAKTQSMRRLVPELSATTQTVSLLTNLCPRSALLTVGSALACVLTIAVHYSIQRDAHCLQKCNASSVHRLSPPQKIFWFEEHNSLLVQLRLLVC